MYQKWPSTLGVSREMIAESWGRYPDLLNEADRFVEEGIARILQVLTSDGTISSLDTDQLSTMLEELGNKISELYFGLDLTRPMQQQLLLRALRSGFTAKPSESTAPTRKIKLCQKQ